MTLEDFENSLAEQKRIDANTAVGQREKEFKKHRRRHRHHDDHRHDLEKDQPRHKRRRRSSSRNSNIRSHDSRNRNPSHTGELTKDTLPQSEEDETGKRDPAILSPASYIDDLPTSSANDRSKRDAWMEGPSALDIDYTQNKTKKPSHPTTSRSSKIDFELKIHENELNKHHLQNLADGKDIPHEVTDESSQHEVDYLFGDAGAQWRMTKLNSVYRRAKETGRLVDDVAQEQFGDLRSFDDAREEQIELERRDTYGEDYVGKQKPSGDLFGERKVDLGIRKDHSHYESRNDGIISEDGPREIAVKPQVGMNVQMDQTTLNRLKAQALKARLRGSSNAVNLEAEFKNATATFVDCEQPDVVILGAMENRTLSGSREGEVKNIDNKRGRERGLVEANDEMSIEDMVREERRTRGQAGGDGRRFAERIAKDGNFNDNLDYLDENASKLARRVQKSEVNFKNTAISDFQKMNRILDNCPLCHHEDTDTPPVAPIVSLATRVYLTLPTEPEISEGGACIVPVQHRNNLLECDDDEWEEMRNFMKSITRMYHEQGRDVIFYENAAVPHRKKHAGMEVVPLPYSVGETAPAFFREAIISSDEEWTQHRKLIDTLSKAKQGLGKAAFRRTLVKEMPYFHVWFEIDGGLGHIVEDSNQWPKGDLFAREIIGGMLDIGPDVIKRQGRWNKGEDGRVEGFRRRWRKFDWTRVLTNS